MAKESKKKEKKMKPKMHDMHEAKEMKGACKMKMPMKKAAGRSR